MLCVTSTDCVDKLAICGAVAVGLCSATCVLFPCLAGLDLRAARTGSLPIALDVLLDAVPAMVPATAAVVKVASAGKV